MLEVSTDPARLDMAQIHSFLANESHWARGIPRATVERACRHSLCFGGYDNGQMVAFARVVSDYATYAYLADVFVSAPHRGKGHSRVLMAAVMAHPDLQGLRRFTLATSSAHGLYGKFGFTAPARPEWIMERYVADIYLRTPA